MRRIVGDGIRVSVFGFAAALAAFGQATTDAKPPEAKPDDTPMLAKPLCIGPVCALGLVDGYYLKNFNNPASRINQLRNFDVKSNQFSLNMAKLGFYADPAPVGFRVEFLFGRAAEIIHIAEPKDAPQVMRNVLQAYISVKPKDWGGLQFDFGKFVTYMGAELTETHLNYNYSRGLLYANGPYYHFGARVTKPVDKHLTLGVHLVNGWNNVEDNNSGKSVGLMATVAGSKASWANNYMFGPEKVDTNAGFRHFYDTVLALTPNDKVSAYLTFDYGIDKKGGPVLSDSKFYGFGAAVKFQVTPMFAVSPRLEVYKDEDGFITGTAQTLKEFTLTGELKMKEPFLARLEYRRDWSDQAYYDRGPIGKSKNMDTILVGFVMYFGK